MYVKKILIWQLFKLKRYFQRTTVLSQTFQNIRYIRGCDAHSHVKQKAHMEINNSWYNVWSATYTFTKLHCSLFHYHQLKNLPSCNKVPLRERGARRRKKIMWSHDIQRSWQISSACVAICARSRSSSYLELKEYKIKAELWLSREVRNNFPSFSVGLLTKYTVCNGDLTPWRWSSRKLANFFFLENALRNPDIYCIFLSVSLVDTAPCENTHCNLRNKLCINEWYISLFHMKKGKKPKPLKSNRKAHQLQKYLFSAKNTGVEHQQVFTVKDFGDLKSLKLY